MNVKNVINIAVLVILMAVLTVQQIDCCPKKHVSVQLILYPTLIPLGAQV